MGKEILNRRQNILADSIPPEIVDTSSFIEATDYATSTTGGTIKVDSTYAIELTSGGKLKAKEITAAGYSEANDAAFISKATLDNVLAAQPAPTVSLACDKILTGPYGNSNTKREFSFPTGKTITDYKFIIVRIAGLNDGTCSAFATIPVALIPTDTSYITCNVYGAGILGDQFMSAYLYKDGINPSYGGSASFYLMDVYAIG